MQAPWRCLSPVTLPDLLLPREHAHSNNYGIAGVGGRGSTCLAQSPRTTPGVSNFPRMSACPVSSIYYNVYVHVRVMSRGGVFLTFRVGQRSYMKLLRGRGTGI